MGVAYGFRSVTRLKMSKAMPTRMAIAMTMQQMMTRTVDMNLLLGILLSRGGMPVAGQDTGYQDIEQDMGVQDIEQDMGVQDIKQDIEFRT